jgi:hypothetical protein
MAVTSAASAAQWGEGASIAPWSAGRSGSLRAGPETLHRFPDCLDYSCNGVDERVIIN